MMTALFTVAVLHWMALVTPGPNVILITQLAASGHRSSALYAGVGISVVALTWALLTVLGVNALFAAHTCLRAAVQIAGGIYLCFFAFKLWGSGTTNGGKPRGYHSPQAAFRLGFITNITNPKTALFFGSVFVAALPPDASAHLLIAAITLVFINALVCHTLLALLFSQASIQAGYDRQRTKLNRLAAAIVGAYGVRRLFNTAFEGK